MNYKDLQNNLHALDSAEFEYLLPAGSVAITDEEAEALRPKPIPPTYQQLRAAAYPSFGEQLGALWKGGEAQAAMALEIQAVKDSIPKT